MLWHRVCGWATPKAQQDGGQTLAASPKCTETGSHRAGPALPSRLSVGGGGQALAIGGGHQKGRFAFGIHPFRNTDCGPELQRGGHPAPEEQSPPLIRAKGVTHQGLHAGRIKGAIRSQGCFGERPTGASLMASGRRLGRWHVSSAKTGPRRAEGREPGSSSGCPAHRPELRLRGGSTGGGPPRRRWAAGWSAGRRSHQELGSEKAAGAAAGPGAGTVGSCCRGPGGQ